MDHMWVRVGSQLAEVQIGASAGDGGVLCDSIWFGRCQGW